MIRIFIIACAIFSTSLFTVLDSFAQCGCFGASVGGVSSGGGMTALGSTGKNNMRVSALFSRVYGSQSYYRDIEIKPFLYESFSNEYLAFSTAYGFSKDFSVEIDAGYFLAKNQKLESYELHGSGFGAVTALGKYSIYKSEARGEELTIGAGLKAPLSEGDKNLVQNMRSSTGAFGAVFQAFYRKALQKRVFDLLLSHRTEINFENPDSYRYGAAFITSAIVAGKAKPWMTLALELRNETRLNDAQDGATIGNSGGGLFFVSPQIAFLISDAQISGFFDFPAYSYYNSKQLGVDYSAGLILSYFFKI